MRQEILTSRSVLHTHVGGLTQTPTLPLLLPSTNTDKCRATSPGPTLIFQAAGLLRCRRPTWKKKHPGNSPRALPRRLCPPRHPTQLLEASVRSFPAVPDAGGRVGWAGSLWGSRSDWWRSSACCREKSSRLRGETWASHNRGTTETYKSVYYVIRSENVKYKTVQRKNPAL